MVYTYKHTQGGIYRVVYPSIHTQGGIPMVVYPSIHTQRGIYPEYTPLYTPLREAYTRGIHHCYVPREAITRVYTTVIHLRRLPEASHASQNLKEEALGSLSCLSGPLKEALGSLPYLSDLLKRHNEAHTAS